MYDTQDDAKSASPAPPALRPDVSPSASSVGREPAHTSLPATDSDTAPAQPHALIVDDEADILDVLVMLLSEDGFRTSACSTQEDAQAVLRSDSVQLLITDLRLAGSDGLDLIRYAQHLEARTPPVILLTAARLPALQHDTPLLQETGARVIAKPFDIDYLLEVARDLTGWHGMPEA